MQPTSITPTQSLLRNKRTGKEIAFSYRLAKPFQGEASNVGLTLFIIIVKVVLSVMP